MATRTPLTAIGPPAATNSPGRRKRKTNRTISAGDADAFPPQVAPLTHIVSADRGHVVRQERVRERASLQNRFEGDVIIDDERDVAPVDFARDGGLAPAMIRCDPDAAGKVPEYAGIVGDHPRIIEIPGPDWIVPVDVVDQRLLSPNDIGRLEEGRCERRHQSSTASKELPMRARIKPNTGASATAAGARMKTKK